jgi:DNA gyrase subunit A
VRLIRVDDGDTVGSLAKLPEEELTAEVPDEVEVPGAPVEPTGDGHPPHILDDGVGGAEASDHIDD